MNKNQIKAKTRHIYHKSLGLFWLVAFPLNSIWKVFRYRNRRIERKQSNRFIFIVPDDFDSSQPNLNGSVKVTDSLLEFLRESSYEVVLHSVGRGFLDSARCLFHLSINRNLIQENKNIIISIPGSSGLIASYLAIFCNKRVFFLAHNAELLHRYEWVRNLQSVRLRLRYVKKALFGLTADFLIANSARHLFVLSEQEIQVYWKRLNFRRFTSVTYLPYIPTKKIRNGEKSKERNKVVVVGSFSKSIGEKRVDSDFLDSGENIRKEIEAMGLEFISVGNGQSLDFCHKNLGFISDEDMVTLSSETFAIIVPMSWGWGFKTKLADALFQNQRVFVPRNLYSRCGSWAQALEPIDLWREFTLSSESGKVYDLIKTVCDNQQEVRDEVVRRAFSDW